MHIDNDLKEDVKVIYNDYVREIEFLKQQQWRMVYYCLLLFGVIFYLTDKFRDEEFILAIFIFLSFVILLAGLSIIINLQRNLQKSRINLSIIRYFYLHHETLSIVGLDTYKRIKRYCSFWKDWKYLAVFFIAILMAFMVVCYKILLLPSCPYKGIYTNLFQNIYL